MLDKIKKNIPVPDEAIYKYTFFLAVFFIFSIILGYYSALLQPEETSKIFEQVMVQYSGLENFGPVTLFLLIFFNNVSITLSIMILGVFFAFTPFLFVWVNGFIFGLAIPKLAANLGTIAVISGISPHGIVEIPAALLSAGYGVWLGRKGYRALRYREPLLLPIKEALKGYFQYILPLFFLAAAIEAFVTEFILNKFI